MKLRGRAKCRVRTVKECRHERHIHIKYRRKEGGEVTTTRQVTKYIDTFVGEEAQQE